MDRPTCATCVFWARMSRDHGECHKNPPAMHFEENEHDLSAFPFCAHDDWCGQHNRFVQWQLAQPVEVSK